ncbi:MAG TPA: hypothetical protein ENJ89_06180 [Caldithrix abyssi]|uniref:DUF5683 domain-containing protein n=1 Tax=Caldithrix abyssi TaxID=187145 RepID=A0A7V5PPZ3_CALAY|nr:hypothetical protein [Caldithrix abyssi]
MSGKRRIVFGLLVLFSALHAQPQQNRASQVKQLYESLQFEQAIQLSQRLLRDDTITNPQDLITIHQYAGFSFFNLGRPDSAKKHFLTILSIDPEYEFNPVNTSPKIITFFKKIKEKYQINRDTDRQVAYVRYVFVRDLRPGATWRSALLPGWGQYFKGQKNKGKILSSSFAGGALLTITSYLLERNYHQKYRDATSQSEIQKNYDAYNRWYKARHYAMYFTAAVWTISVLDAIWAPYSSTALTLNWQGDGMLSLRISF